MTELWHDIAMMDRTNARRTARGVKDVEVWNDEDIGWECGADNES
jgi:hypothetical protein